MRSLIALVLSLAIALPALAADVPEARLKDLIRRAGDGSLEEINSEVEPGAFEARPLVEQAGLCTGTRALARLVAFGEFSPLRQIVPALTWTKLLAAEPTLREVGTRMARALHLTTHRALLSRDVAASRLLVGTANLYLRQSGEAQHPAEKSIHLFIAATAAEVGSDAQLQELMLKLATDPLATPEVRQRAGFLYPLIADTAARARVAVLQFQDQHGGW